LHAQHAPSPCDSRAAVQRAESVRPAARGLRRWHGLALLLGACAGLAACGDGSGKIQLGNEAQIDLYPTVLAFPDVPRGEVARLNVTVRHIGTGGTIDLAPIKLETDSLDLTIGTIERESLAPGEEARIQIVYTSGHDEPDRGTLVIGHNISGNPESRIAITTPGQRARLVSIPQNLDFGIVQAASPRTIDVRVLNGGTAPATLVDYQVEGDDAGDFSAAIPANAVVPPAGEITVPVIYAPTGRNIDDVVITFTTDREDVKLALPTHGEEETPILAVLPSLVQLGWVRPFEIAAKDVVIKNDGNTDLVLQSVTLEDAPNVLTLTNRPSAPFTLRPGEDRTFGIVFSPVQEVPMRAEPLGKIRFVSNDEARTPFIVPVFGAAGEPSIVVIPESTVDFAFVAEGFTSKRTVTVLNNGASAVTITQAKLVDPSTDEFVFANAESLPKVLNPGESHELQLTFENKRGASGSAFARFFLYTTDPVVPEYPLDVVARRAQRPTCEAAFVPDLLALGAHKPGTTSEGRIIIMNTGSGNCEYREREFDACLGEPFGISFNFVCDDQVAFNPFQIVSEPAPQTIIGPGELITFGVRFKAPAVRSEYGRDSYYARLAAILFDPNSSTLRFVTPPGGIGRGVNVRAESAVPLVTVDPRTIDFGLVRTDCASDVSQVRVRADGPMDATITAVTPVGCGSDVRVSGPAVPTTVPGFSAVYYNVTFAPGTAAPVDCRLHIENDSQNLPSVDVALSGVGTDKTRQVDELRQIPAPKVDVLFVVDDSFSMGDDQERMRQELPRIVDIARQWGQDYRFGITTTDTLKVRGAFKGYPRYADTTTDLAAFSENLLVGTAGFYIEKGLEGAYLALYNRAGVTETSCDAAVPGQCPRNDGDGVPLLCLDLGEGGYCSGRNAGFLRDDAELVIIMVSDEEDSSPQTVGWYVDRLSDLKKPGSGHGVIFHSIITPVEGCIGGFGTPGLRYVQVTEALGGMVVSLCAPDFGAEFERVGARTFGLKDRFYTSLPPDPTTLSVTVNGAPCLSGWAWNAAVNAVVFDPDAACFPQFDDRVEIAYDVYCAASDVP
jgi:hypothetical protein